MVRMRSCLLIATLCLLPASMQAQDAYTRSVDVWHAERITRLAAEDGWLSLIGRDWLNPGENTLGSAQGTALPTENQWLCTATPRSPVTGSRATME